MAASRWKKVVGANRPVNGALGDAIRRSQCRLVGTCIKCAPRDGEGGGGILSPRRDHPQAQRHVGRQQRAARQQQEEADELALLAVRHHGDQRGLQQRVQHPLAVEGEARHRVHHGQRAGEGHHVPERSRVKGGGGHYRRTHTHTHTHRHGQIVFHSDCAD